MHQQRRSEICNGNTPAKLIEDEIMKFEPADLGDILEDCPPDMTVDEWNKVYAEVTIELHEAIAKQLLKEREEEESFYLELNDKFSELAIEQQVETLTGEGWDSSVCAVCKSDIVRRFGRRITCNRKGCIDMHFPLVNLDGNQVIPLFKVEQLMNNMCSVIADHTETQNDKCIIGQNEVEVGLVRECG